ncbi:MAG: hypothetical protein MR038_01865 [Oscillospiraceae bacterium]|nr:hypothetical protein [Oscillospiraceae bacterium]
MNKQKTKRRTVREDSSALCSVKIIGRNCYFRSAFLLAAKMAAAADNAAVEAHIIAIADELLSAGSSSSQSPAPAETSSLSPV